MASIKTAQADHGEAVTEIAIDRRLVAEAVGTFGLMLGGVGTAVFSGVMPGGLSYGFVTLGFGLAVIAGAYAFGPISGGHFNPAVTLGLAIGGRFPWRNVIPYVCAQLIGAVVSAGCIFVVMTLAGKKPGTMASNGYTTAVIGHDTSIWAAALIEIIVTGIFLCVILGVTSKLGNSTMAGLVIGLTLALMLMIAAPIDNGSLNPARSLAAAIFGGADALKQVWVFIVFPLVGAAIAGLTHKALNRE